MNYLQLQTELEDSIYEGKTDSEILALLNTPFAGALDYTPRSVVNNYAANNDVLRRLYKIINTPYVEGSANDSEIEGTGGYTLREVAQEGINLFTINTGDLVNPNNAKLNACVNILLALEVFEQSEVDGFWDVFRAYSLKFEREVNENDLNRARWNGQIAAFVAVRDAKLQELATIEGCIADLEAGNAYHELSEVE